MAQNIEDFLPPIQSAGLNTLQATKIGNTLNSKAPVLASSGNTSPTAAQSGSTFLFDSSTGITFTLPAPSKGLQYTFVVANTVTSGTHAIVTNNYTTDFLYGALVVAGTVATGTNALIAQGNGTTHIGVVMNGSTTGGILGTRIHVVATSSTLWEVSGVVAGSGNVATPFSTS